MRRAKHHVTLLPAPRAEGVTLYAEHLIDGISRQRTGDIGNLRNDSSQELYLLEQGLIDQITTLRGRNCCLMRAAVAKPTDMASFLHRGVHLPGTQQRAPTFLVVP